MTMRRVLLRLLNAITLFALLLFLWQCIIWVFHLAPYVLPTPWAIARVVVQRFPALWSSLLTSAIAAGGGLLASIVVGVAIAMLFAQSRWLREMLLPYTILLQTVPIVAIAPLLLMWIGPGLFAVTLVAFIICLAPIIANTTQGLIGVDRNMVDLFTMHNATRAQILWKLRLPHALPALFTGIRIASGISVIGAITGDLFAGSATVGQGGLGYSITYALAQVQTDYLFALVFAATMLGFFFFFAVVFLEWCFLHHWHESVQTGDR
ncbi:NitT/TauT family transport system permease protein [Granulicella rosea]|uniref:NitT/TauT family transport system permease protein n=1 Tax=Granulicella rosea TaxID=474952 RepID=A0A239MAI8_9BACT|nr:ABC transporter permease [Granulicella rosea]SNT38869.1 NitT/TauT family transport system permease protein [Granulicella rosea]